MRVLLKTFVTDEGGQDLVEYALIIAFVVLASAALFLGGGRSAKGVWGTAGTQLTTANTSAS